jgi:hypothetical protein
MGTVARRPFPRGAAYNIFPKRYIQYSWAAALRLSHLRSQLLQTDELALYAVELRYRELGPCFVRGSSLTTRTGG